jgi:hypothetical protein
VTEAGPRSTDEDDRAALRKHVRRGAARPRSLATVVRACQRACARCRRGDPELLMNDRDRRRRLWR